MTKGGFSFHPIWTNLPKFIEKLDVDKVKVKAGLKKAARGAKAPTSSLTPVP